MPSVNDPHLFMVRVKKGGERIATMSLMNKAIAMAKENNPLAILSVTTSDNVEGIIYVEAYKELNVREAIKGLSVILQGKIMLVPMEEMP